MHLITWCDTVNNLNRYFTHQILREFEMRVLFQMSPNDSGHMLDSPHASKLGPHRAPFHSEEQNRLEKFRPYGIPADEWLDGSASNSARRIESLWSRLSLREWTSRHDSPQSLQGTRD